VAVAILLVHLPVKKSSPEIRQIGKGIAKKKKHGPFWPDRIDDINPSLLNFRFVGKRDEWEEINLEKSDLRRTLCVCVICLVFAVQLVTKVIRDRRLVTSKLTWCSTKRGGILSQATTPLLYLVPFGLCCYCQIGERIGHVKDLTCHLLLSIPNGQEYQNSF
jgi:hypothetical protein